MHLYKALVSLSTLLTLVCYAAPVVRVSSTRHILGNLTGRFSKTWESEVASRDSNESTDRLERRGYKPVPNSWLYKTHTNTVRHFFKSGYINNTILMFILSILEKTPIKRPETP